MGGEVPPIGVCRLGFIGFVPVTDWWRKGVPPGGRGIVKILFSNKDVQTWIHWVITSFFVSQMGWVNNGSPEGRDRGNSNIFHLVCRLGFIGWRDIKTASGDPGKGRG